MDVVITGDDLGTQDSTLMAPAAYRRLIKPHEAEVLAAIKENTGRRCSSIPAATCTR